MKVSKSAVTRIEIQDGDTAEQLNDELCEFYSGEKICIVNGVIQVSEDDG